MKQSTLKNRTIFCKDNLGVLRGINSNSIDLIYLDPPFNKKKEFTAPIGSSAEGASFSDWFREEDVKDEWIETIKEDYDGIYKFLKNIKELSSFHSHKNKHYLYNYCYLCYIAIRLIEMHRILKDTGSIYLHCDSTMSHYLKILMDLIFGENNFRNEIVWHYRRWTAGNKNFQKMHDIVYRYSKTNEYLFNLQYEPYGDWIKKDYSYIDEETSKRWRWHTVKGKKYKVFLEDENKGTKLNDVWIINHIGSTSKERTGYPTQKPLALLERIIKASSSEGDIVLDPFCGCATTCVAAEKLGRQWIGIDVSILAFDLVKKRLNKEIPNELWEDKAVNFATAIPKRTDEKGFEIEKKWVYVISNESYKDEYKVGVASDWKTRLNSYQTSDPNRAYKVEYKIYTPFFREIEKHIHKKFENRHEWVRAKLNDIIEGIKDYEKRKASNMSPSELKNNFSKETHQ